MAELDRDRLIEHLELLGSQDDAIALQAARSVERMVADAGAAWEDILRPLSVAADPVEETDDAAPIAVDSAADAEVIDALLARGDLSEELREELTGLRRDLDEGEFAAMDSNYVRALARRLTA